MENNMEKEYILMVKGRKEKAFGLKVKE